MIYEKAKFLCFICMQLHEVKFKFVQINMKQVSYYQFIHLKLKLLFFVWLNIASLIFEFLSFRIIEFMSFYPWSNY